MPEPKRIQRKRTKGWRMPETAVYVGRPTIYGNPFMADCILGLWVCRDAANNVQIPCDSEHAAKSMACRLYRSYLENDGSQPGQIRDDGGAMVLIRAKEELRGKDLACWCGEGPCHADVLLELANQ